MPIRVHCPNGCLLRMPTERAGKIIRCPGCKSVIAIPVISESEKSSGKPIPYSATLVKLRETDHPSTHTPYSENPGESHSLDRFKAGLSQSTHDQEYCEFVEDRRSEQLKAIEARIDEHPSLAPLEESVPIVLFIAENASKEEGRQSSTSEASGPVEASALTHPECLPSPSIVNEFTPLQLQLAESQQKSQLQKIVDSFESVGGPAIFPSETASRRPRYRRVKPPRVQGVAESPLSPGAGNDISVTSWKARLLNANRDRIVLSRLLCFLILASALISVLPAVMAWYTQHQNEPGSVPRWIFILVFLAGVKCLYAIFIFQIADWSALKGASIAALVFAFLYGLTATGLLIERGHGGLSDFLELSHLIVQNATIWSVFMLCLETLIAYGSGKEAADWKRSEQLLFEIESQRSA